MDAIEPDVTACDVSRLERRMIGDPTEPDPRGQRLVGGFVPDLAGGARGRRLLQLAAQSAVSDDRLLDASR